MRNYHILGVYYGILGLYEGYVEVLLGIYWGYSVGCGFAWFRNAQTITLRTV